MNTESGHLVRDVLQLSEAERPKYSEVPLELEAEAEAALAGQNEAHDNVRGPGRLAAWARADRRRRRRQLEKQGRRAARKGRR